MRKCEKTKNLKLTSNKLTKILTVINGLIHSNQSRRHPQSASQIISRANSSLQSAVCPGLSVQALYFNNIQIGFNNKNNLLTVFLISSCSSSSSSSKIVNIYCSRICECLEVCGLTTPGWNFPWQLPLLLLLLL